MVAARTRTWTASLCLAASCAGAPVAPGSPAPEVLLLDGSRVPWPSLLGPRDATLVVFATLWCEVCRRERPAVTAWARAHQGSHRTVYVFSGSELPGAVEQIRALHLDPALTVVVDSDGRLADRYAVQSTPTLLVIGADGRVLATAHRFEAVHLE